MKVLCIRSFVNYPWAAPEKGNIYEVLDEKTLPQLDTMGCSLAYRLQGLGDFYWTAKGFVPVEDMNVDALLEKILTPHGVPQQA